MATKTTQEDAMEKQEREMIQSIAQADLSTAQYLDTLADLLPDADGLSREMRMMMHDSAKAVANNLRESAVRNLGLIHNNG